MLSSRTFPIPHLSKVCFFDFAWPFFNISFNSPLTKIRSIPNGLLARFVIVLNLIFKTLNTSPQNCFQRTKEIGKKVFFPRVDVAWTAIVHWMVYPSCENAMLTAHNSFNWHFFLKSTFNLSNLAVSLHYSKSTT